MPLPADRDAMTIDRTRPVAPQLAEHLRDRILVLDLAPGEILSRPALQERFGLSQTPLRDALLQLASEDLVTIHPQARTLVSRIDIAHARQAHFMRRAIEADAARLLAAMPERVAAVAALERANAAVTQQQGDLAAFLAADLAFHFTLFTHADLMRLWPVLRRNSGHLDRVRMLNLPNVGTGRVIALHDRVIAEIAAGRPDQAFSAMYEHLSSTLAAFDWVRQRYPDFVAP
jgi:DNA-binding GntR family transcriptional regulator